MPAAVERSDTATVAGDKGFVRKAALRKSEANVWAERIVYAGGLTPRR